MKVLEIESIRAYASLVIYAEGPCAFACKRLRLHFRRVRREISYSRLDHSAETRDCDSVKGVTRRSS